MLIIVSDIMATSLVRKRKPITSSARFGSEWVVSGFQFSGGKIIELCCVDRTGTGCRCDRISLRRRTPYDVNSSGTFGGR